MPTASDLIKSALTRINSYAQGEPLLQPDAQSCLDTLNDMLDSWSIDKQLIYGSIENIFQLQAGQPQYRIGNPLNTSLGLPNFTGYVTGGSPIIAGIVGLPTTGLVAGAVGISQAGSTISDVGAAIPAGAQVLSIITGSTTAITFTAPPVGTSATISGYAGGAFAAALITFSDAETRVASITVGGLATWVGALTGTPTAGGNTLNTTSITLSQNASVTPANNPDTISYTLPGDFAIPRPNRITHGFTRFSLLDFTIEVTMSQSRFLEILYKAQPGPWPTVAWYNPQEPYGLINFYQTPGNAAELHLFTDTILSNLTINQTFVLPQGYSRAIKWALAKEICAEYGYPMTEAIKTNGAEALAMIKALNALPAEKAKYDRMLMKGGKYGNAQWVFTGGYS